jgi:hypothetical protein
MGGIGMSEEVKREVITWGFVEHITKKWQEKYGKTLKVEVERGGIHSCECKRRRPVEESNSFWFYLDDKFIYRIFKSSFDDLGVFLRAMELGREVL